MKKHLFKDKEFEANKKEILRRMKATNPNNLAIEDKRYNAGKQPYNNTENRIYAWEYEIKEYRKQKRLELFYKIGAFSGVLSLIITIIDKFMPIREITYTALNHIFK